MKRKKPTGEVSIETHGTEESKSKDSRTAPHSVHPAQKGDVDDTDKLNDQTELWITVIDVGQGESTLIRYRERKSGTWNDIHVVLVDGGRAHFAKDTIIPTLDELDVKKIHTMVCSHYDADHMEGLGLLTKYKPDVVYERSSSARKSDDKVKSFRNKYTGKTSQISEGDIIDFSEQENAPVIKCVCVDNGGELWNLENDYSIGLLVKFGKFSFYLGGDLTHHVEDGLKLGNHVCAFKCGHHGSKHSTSLNFLNKIKPNAAFISAASHSYCHPDDETIKRLCNSQEVKQFYLTNCVYNRAGVNSKFCEKEAELKQLILTKISDWKRDNSELIEVGKIKVEEKKAAKREGEKAEDEKEETETVENTEAAVVDGFESFVSFDKILEITDEESYLALLNSNVLTIKPGELRKVYPGLDYKPVRKKWNELASLYFAAHDIHIEHDERKNRTKPKETEETEEKIDSDLPAKETMKGIVAASETHLGNLHLIVSGEDALKKTHKFSVYFSEGETIKMFAHQCGEEPTEFPEADRDYVKAVKRKVDGKEDGKEGGKKDGYEFIPSFSLITGPSGEEKQDGMPDEVKIFFEKFETLMTTIIECDDESFLNQAELVLDEEELKEEEVEGIDTFRRRYAEMMDLYDKLDSVEAEASETEQEPTDPLATDQNEDADQKVEITEIDAAEGTPNSTEEAEMEVESESEDGGEIDPTEELREAIENTRKAQAKEEDEEGDSYSFSDDDSEGK